MNSRRPVNSTDGRLRVLQVISMRRRLLAFLGVLYAAGYLLLAIFTSGGGHGPYFTFAGLMPYGAGLLVFPVLAFLMGSLSSAPIRIAYAVVLFVYSATVIAFVWVWLPDDLPYANRAWEASPLNILLPVAWYLFGQIILWAALVRAVFGRDADAPSNNSLHRSAGQHASQLD